MQANHFVLTVPYDTSSSVYSGVRELPEKYGAVSIGDNVFNANGTCLYEVIETANSYSDIVIPKVEEVEGRAPMYTDSRRIRIRKRKANV